MASGSAVSSCTPPFSSASYPYSSNPPSSSNTNFYQGVASSTHLLPSLAIYERHHQHFGEHVPILPAPQPDPKPSGVRKTSNMTRSKLGLVSEYGPGEAGANKRTLGSYGYTTTGHTELRPSGPPRSKWGGYAGSSLRAGPRKGGLTERDLEYLRQHDQDSEAVWKTWRVRKELELQLQKDEQRIAQEASLQRFMSHEEAARSAATSQYAQWRSAKEEEAREAQEEHKVKQIQLRAVTHYRKKLNKEYEVLAKVREKGFVVRTDVAVMPRSFADWQPKEDGAAAVALSSEPSAPRRVYKTLEEMDAEAEASQEVLVPLDLHTLLTPQHASPQYPAELTSPPPAGEPSFAPRLSADAAVQEVMQVLREASPPPLQPRSGSTDWHRHWASGGSGLGGGPSIASSPQQAGEGGGGLHLPPLARSSPPVSERASGAGQPGMMVWGTDPAAIPSPAARGSHSSVASLPRLALPPGGVLPGPPGPSNSHPGSTASRHSHASSPPLPAGQSASVGLQRPSLVAEDAQPLPYQSPKSTAAAAALLGFTMPEGTDLGELPMGLDLQGLTGGGGQDDDEGVLTPGSVYNSGVPRVSPAALSDALGTIGDGLGGEDVVAGDCGDWDGPDLPAPPAATPGEHSQEVF